MTITDCELWGDPARVCHPDLDPCEHDDHLFDCATIDALQLDNPNVTHYEIASNPATIAVPPTWASMSVDERTAWLFDAYPGGFVNGANVCWPDGFSGPGSVRGVNPGDPLPSLWAVAVTYTATEVACPSYDELLCALEAATEIVWLLTGQQFGICDDCIEICPVPCNYDCCLGHYICLPNHPAIDSPRGDVFYRNGCSYLQLDAPVEQGETICYRWGHEPPKSVVRAAECLATQFLLKECGSDKCELPTNTQSINRQGLSATLVVDLANQFAEGLTGITEVDRVIKAWNPKGLCRPPRIIDPDCCVEFVRRPRTKDLENA